MIGFKWFLSLVGVAGVVASAVPIYGSDLVSINFESGSVGEPGSPINGWQKVAVGAGVAPSIGSTGRTFLTGSNDEALFIKPFTPGATGSFSGGPPANYQGVVFRPSTPITIPAGSNVYMIMEHFGDIALPGNAIKYRFAAGKEGNGGQFLGFDSAAQDTFRQEISYEVRTDGTERSFQGFTREGATAGQNRYFRNSQWNPDDVAQFGAPLNTPVGGNASNNFLDRSYESTVLFRPDGANTDMEGQVRDSFGSLTRQDGTFSSTGAPSDTVDDQPAVSAVTLDYFFLALSRFNSTYDGPGGEVDPRPNFPQDPLAYSSKAQYALDDPINNPGGYVLSNASELMLGVKSLRFGIAAPGDFNIDGLVNAADKAIAQANLGKTEATFFDGDFNNDGVVDGVDVAFFSIPGDFDNNFVVDGADFLTWQRGVPGTYGPADLADWKANFGAGSATPVVGAVPEPSSLVLIGCLLSAAGFVRRR